ncbi:glucosamine inositolphosphorylceramide transferase family protein [Nitrospira lenta]|nr:hypothetical protein [Nitrospira lenta]
MRRLKTSFKDLVSRLTRSGNHLLFEAEHFEHLWSIGIYTGTSPLALAPVPGLTQPVLTRDDVTDVCALMVADPFMINAGGMWYMFFELYNRASHGEIGYATSLDGLTWTYQRVVLAEPFHLSYPYVFEWAGEYYMIPESHLTGEVRLYRARRFPDQWEQAGVLLKGHAYSDSSIIRHEGRWWMWTESSQGRFDTLRLYMAEELLGPWEAHPRNPIIELNAQRARPAGRVIQVGARLIRFSQNCYPTYGVDVRAFEITELSPTAYQSEATSDGPVLGPSGSGWNKCGMHHIDAHLQEDGQWLACVDGWTAVPSLLENLKPMR